MNIQFSDLKQGYISIKDEIDEAIQKVLNDGNYILGQQVDTFQKEFAEYSGYKYCVGTSSGTSAIELMLRSLPQFKNQTIIIPANTFIASCIGSMAGGFNVRLADVDEETQLVTKETIEAAANDATTVIMPVNLFGRVVSNDIPEYAKYSSRYFVYDACQSHGVDQLPYPAAYSFYPAKNLGGIGDAGAVVANDEERYNELLALRNYGSTQKYVHDSYGRNERMDTINAAVLSVKLKYLPQWNKNRLVCAMLYDELLADIGDIKRPPLNQFNTDTNWHLYVIRTEYRDELMKYLKDNGIPAQIHYPYCVHQNKVYEGYDFGSGNKFPIAEKLAKQILSLPIHPFITESEIEYTVEKIHDFFANSSHKSKGWFD